MNIIIRKALKSDAYDLANILTSSWSSAYKNIIPKNELEMQNNIEQRVKMFEMMLENPRGEFYIAIEGTTPCGQFMFCKSRDIDLSEYAEIVSIYALESYWDKGIGSIMMKYALSNIIQMNYEKVFLWVFKDNLRARKFYEKFGFVLDGNEKKSQFSNGATEIRYVLKL